MEIYIFLRITSLNNVKISTFFQIYLRRFNAILSKTSAEFFIGEIDTDSKIYS